MDYKETYEKILGEYRQVFERVDQDNMRAFIDEVKAHDRIFLIGVGREGMATRAFAMRLMHMGKEIHWIWDDTTFDTSLFKIFFVPICGTSLYILYNYSTLR